MTTQEKTHMLELSEREIAAILFLLTKSNGTSNYRVWKLCRDILVKTAYREVFINKHKSLSEVCGYHNTIDYCSVEKEWETFLGIGISEKNKALLDKIADMEKELAELKEML